MDYKCCGKCPPPLDSESKRCCVNCQVSRRYFLNDSNKHLWTDTDGFWSESGCKLSRDEMPDWCKDYDCRKYQRAVFFTWINNKWHATHFQELFPGKGVVFVDVSRIPEIEREKNI